MAYLAITTLMWAFSFSLIGEFLGGIDAYFAVLVRVGLAAIIFFPFVKFNAVPKKLGLMIMVIGAVQVGLMYLFFYHSFAYLKVSEVVLFTVFTPFYVTLMYDALHRTFRPLYLLSTGVAVLGAYIIRYYEIDSTFIKGFLLVQGANICFALGQSAYKKVMESHTTFTQRDGFLYFHLGALSVVGMAFVFLGDTTRTTPTLFQWGVLLWLGVIASGLGYFWWNKGACQVDAGILAIMNNALVPAGLFVNLFFWEKPTHLSSLLIGSVVIAFSLWLHHYFIASHPQTP